MQRRRQLTSVIEPFDSFWEAPDDIEKGYASFAAFYKANYSRYFPARKDAPILCVSCGPGYGVALLASLGYTEVVGIDSFPEKIAHATRKGLNCQVGFAFDHLEGLPDNSLELIFVEQEINHLTKPEILDFLDLCLRKLIPGGRILCFVLNGANPLTGAEALAQNFDHHNTFTEYTLRQVLEYKGYSDIRVFGLHLYVFYRNPINYVAWAASSVLSLLFRACFVLYGKKNTLFHKKIAATAVKPK